MSRVQVSLPLKDSGKILSGIHTAFEPANDEVISNGHDPSSSDRVVCTDIRDDVDFGSNWHV
jgi:hypothetical protein